MSDNTKGFLFAVGIIVFSTGLEHFGLITLGEHLILIVNAWILQLLIKG